MVIAGRYRLRSTVGAGGMGEVWRAEDLRLNREVALKRLRLPPDLPPDEAALARERVFREGRIAARLQHPHAVAVFDVTADDSGQPMLVLEYLPSRSLASALTDHGTLRPGLVARIGAAIASALAAAHAVGIVHRDVKPGNILLTPDGDAKITDFGLSHLAGDVTDGFVAGTPVYLSPEAARGEPPSPESDVFSLGATLYAAVEGGPPFGTADDPAVQLERVAEGQAPPPSQAGPLTPVLMGMLRDDPDERPTMSRVADALAGLAEPFDPRDDGDTGPVPAPTMVELVPVPPRRRRRVYVVLGLLAAALLGVLAVILLTRQEEENGGPATGPATGPSSAAPPVSTESTVSSAPVPAPVDPAQFQRVVTDYYTLLPVDTAGAWALLGPGMQAQNREQYDAFWSTVRNLDIRGGPTVSGNAVLVEIEYVQRGNGRVRETHRHEILVQDGIPLINSDEVIATN